MERDKWPQRKVKEFKNVAESKMGRKSEMFTVRSTVSYCNYLKMERRQMEGKVKGQMEESEKRE